MKKMFCKELMDFIAIMGHNIALLKMLNPEDMHTEAPDVCIVRPDVSRYQVK